MLLNERITREMLLGAEWDESAQLFIRRARCDETARLRTFFYNEQGELMEWPEVRRHFATNFPEQYLNILNAENEGLLPYYEGYVMR